MSNRGLTRGEWVSEEPSEVDCFTIHAVVSLFEPDETVCLNCQKIALQVDEIVLCDNSDYDNCSLFADIPNCVYIPNLRNLGLPKAFNSVLCGEGKSWDVDDVVVFFDQDSSIDEGYIEILARQLAVAESKCGQIGCIGPLFYNTSNEKIESPRHKVAISDGIYRVPCIITSSMMMRMSSLLSVGQWDEHLFLDYVDWDICWRMRSIGLICCVTDKVLLRHSVGSGEKSIGPIRLRVEQVNRTYYQVRDAIYLIRQGHVPLVWKLRLLSYATIKPLLNLVFLGNRFSRLRWMINGYSDVVRR